MGERVLVTGGTGYLAAWVIAGLLERGDEVRTTVRNLDDADRVRAAVGEQVGATAAASLEVVAADLQVDEGWDVAFGGIDVVVHTASPMTVPTGQDIVQIARAGMHRVLTAAARAGVRRAVVTSSGVTIIPVDPGATADETVWATPPENPRLAYDTSKILAERDAWELASRTGLELVTVLPTFMQGPTLGRPGPAGSTQVVARLLDGSLPAVPNVGWDVVDVRDVADLHVLAVTRPQAAGRRLLASGEFVRWRDLARILRERLPHDAAKVTTRTMPDLVVRLLALVNPQLARISPNLGRKVTIDGSVTRQLLDWRPRPLVETVVDTATSVLRSSGRAA